MDEIMVSPRSTIKVHFRNKRTRRINRALCGEMETNFHRKGLRSMDEVDPQTNQWLGKCLPAINGVEKRNMCMR